MPQHHNVCRTKTATQMGIIPSMGMVCNSEAFASPAIASASAVHNDSVTLNSKSRLKLNCRQATSKRENIASNRRFSSSVTVTSLSRQTKPLRGPSVRSASFFSYKGSRRAGFLWLFGRLTKDPLWDSRELSDGQITRFAWPGNFALNNRAVRRQQYRIRT